MFRYLRQHPIAVVFGVLLVSMGVFAGYRIFDRPTAARMDDMAAPVIVATVRPVDFADRIQAIGTAKANESVEITAKVTDTVRRVNFEDGMEVEAGQVLVELTRAEELALLEEAKATLAEAEQQHRRIADLVSRGSASRARLDEQTRIRDAARARVDALEARLADRLIRAPFSGILGFRQVSPGTLISPGTVITTLDDVDPIKLDFAVPEGFLSSLKPGLEIEARAAAYGDRVFSGVVQTIESRVDPATRAVTVRAIIANPERLLRPGMLLTVDVIRNRQRLLAVPEEALIPIQSRQYVYVVRDDGTAERVAVELGRRRPGVVEVRAGLKEGDRVVVEGAIRLTPGAIVRILQERDILDRSAAGSQSPV
ncbi:MAG: efflux RND transporter periplasmic adaptor subunit [Alphaproteobacteria bacterium]|nr:MAG: efflux RND transporter periplasmic adaptor subunit [Alphaproteobacteria bacterium]